MYGCIDTASLKVIWLRIWTDNCDPKRIADGILITSLRIAPARLKINNKDSGTADIATMHTFLRCSHGDLEDCSGSVTLGKSTANQIK